MMSTEHAMQLALIVHTALEHLFICSPAKPWADELNREAYCLVGTSTRLQDVAQALSNTVWAFSKLEVLDEELFGAIAKEATGKLPRFNAQNIANTVRRTPAVDLALKHHKSWCHQRL